VKNSLWNGVTSPTFHESAAASQRFILRIIVWPNRDPKQERGGRNLYGFVRNNSIIYVDPFGLQSFGIPTSSAGWQSAQAGAAASWATQQPSPYIPNAFATYNPKLPPSTDPGTASQYGWAALKGTAPDVYLGPDSPWTKEMQHSREVQIDRNRAINQLKTFCDSDPVAASLRIQIDGQWPENVPLGGELGGQPDSIPWYVYPLDFGIDYVSNPTAAFIGSWTSGKITFGYVDCCNHLAMAHFHAVNVSGWSSGTHLPPILGYGSHLLDDNAFGLYGYGHNVSQTFDWDEFISF